MMFSYFERKNSHIGIEKTPKLHLGGSSGEYWTMREILILQYCVSDEDFYSCKALSLGKIMTVPKEEVPANFVPAAAVIRRGLVLFIMTGRKAYVGG